MSSSTSSSSAQPRPRAARAIYIKILLVITLGMGASMAIIRLITFLNDVSGETIMGRVLEARAALPRMVAEEDDLVMVFGTSMVDAGFSARQFDRQLAERGVADIKSFNFGFGGLNPYFQDYLARRIRDAFDAENRRLALTLIEFNPFQNTTSRFDGARESIDSFVTMLATPRELWEVLRDDPQRGVRMFNIRYLRDEISAEMITWHFGRSLREPRPRSTLPEDEEVAERRRELGQKLGEQFDKDYPDYTGEDWYYPWQGAGTIPEERSEETHALFRQYYETRRTPRRMENDKLNRVACCDIEGLHFEEELVQAFVRIVKTFQGFSDHVEVILLPRNSEWIRYTPEAAERLAAVLDRIRTETGVTIKSYQEIEGITPQMYSDATHLSRYAGDVAFTAILVDEHADLLAQR